MRMFDDCAPKGSNVKRKQAWGKRALRSLGDLYRTSIVVAAIRAGTMRELLRVAVWTFSGGWGRCLVVRATFPSTGFRMAAFWVWHGSDSWITLLISHLLPLQPLELFPSRINNRLLTGALFRILILAAIRAEPLTILFTKDL